MSETRAEDMTPLTERKSINSSFLRRGVRDEGLRPSQQSEADVGANSKGPYHYIISEREKGEEKRKGVVWVWRSDGKGWRKRDKKRETWTLREMDAEGARE